ncbi:rhodanese-like domain-containing protein, partial [Halobacterium bonnevillei]|uniref:rhodanese-like domain-containing protein n=1 Tax=Halobacterium bonnevillei TaxID=2692200 RepID=UPI001914F186
MTPPSISARELYDRIREGAVSVLDVRDRDEFDAWHVDGPGVTAEHVPYMEFVSAQVTGDAGDLVPADLDEPIVAVCTDLVGKCWGTVDTEDANIEIVDEMTFEGDPDRLRHVFENLFR